MHIDDLINEKLGDPVGNLVAAALDSGISLKQVTEAVRIGLVNGIFEHKAKERSPGDHEPRYTEQVIASEK